MSEEKVSGTIAAGSGGKRVRTRFTGVYTREIINKRTQKPDAAFDIAYRDQDGKLIWEFVGYKSDGVSAGYASSKRGAILDSISRGEKPRRRSSEKVMTFAEAWKIFEDKWLPNVARPQEEKSRYANHIAPALAKRRLDAITTLTLEELKSKLLAKGLAPGTVRHVLSDVRRVYRKLAAWGLYEGRIPTEGLIMPKLDNARTRFLTEDEALKLLAALKERSPTWHDIAFLSLYTGMRKGEILALSVEHLDFAAGRILVKDAKTGSRTVYMTAEVESLLKERVAMARHGLLFRRRRKEGGLISPDADESFVRTVEALKLNEGINDRRHRVVFHTLRHTYCSWLAMAGESLYTIGELVGHSSMEMTKRYSHLCPDTKREASARIGLKMAAASAAAETRKEEGASHGSTASAPVDNPQRPAAGKARSRRP